MLRSGAQLLLFTLIAGAFLARESHRDPVSKLDDAVGDFLSAKVRRAAKPSGITLVGIDENAMRDPLWPWTPVDFALFFSSANSFQPRVLATDEILDWDPRTLSPENAEKLPQVIPVLRDQVLRSPKVVLGAELSFPDDAEKLPPLDPIPGFRNVHGDAMRIPEFRIIERQAVEPLRSVATQGFTNLAATTNHRTIPLLWRYCGQVVPSFVLQTVILWEKATIEEVAIELGSWIRVGSLEIPIDDAGRMRIDFSAEPGRTTFSDLVLGAEQRDAGSTTDVSANLFSDRVVLLSRVDPKAMKLPLGTGHSGSRGELFGAAIATIQNRAFIRQLPVQIDVLIVAALGVLAFFLPRLSLRVTCIIAAFLGIGYAAAIWTCFSLQMLLLPAVLPLGLLLVLVVARSTLAPPPKAPAPAPVQEAPLD